MIQWANSDQLSEDVRETTTEPQAEAIRFERRRDDRRQAGGRITLLRRREHAKEYQLPICSIQLRDMSQGGLGAHCDVPLQVDEAVTVCIPPHGAERGFDVRGHVTRCDRGPADGYQVGIAFDPPAAA